MGWFVHCYVTEWKPSTYKKMLVCFVEILESAPHKEVFAMSYNDKLSKFASLFGMNSVDTITDGEGNEGELLCVTLL